MDDLHTRLLSADRQLQGFLKRVEHLSRGGNDVDANDLRVIGGLLRSLGPEVYQAAHSDATDSGLRALIREYTGNLRALQASLEQVQCVMLTRRAQMDAERRRLNGLEGWTRAYRQTT